MKIPRYQKPLAFETGAQYIIDRLKVAHEDLTRIVGILRDPGQAVKTIGQDNAFSLKGWRDGFLKEFQLVQQFNAARRAQVNAELPASVGQALDAYLDAMPRIGQALQAAVAKHQNAQGELILRDLPQADRDALATAIEAELA